MSRTARSGGLVSIIACALLASCARPTMDPNVGPHALADAAPPIHVNFTCDGVNQVSLTDDDGNPAWAFKAKRNDPVSWVVLGNVNINAITSKSPAIPLPLTTPGPQGGNGNPYRAQVNSNAQSRHYLYSIDVTCTPTSGGGAPVRLVIDPDMIVP